jgi:hypothetical protein
MAVTTAVSEPYMFVLWKKNILHPDEVILFDGRDRGLIMCWERGYPFKTKITIEILIVILWSKHRFNAMSAYCYEYKS